MSYREDFFMAHAPAVPEWFDGPEFKIPPRPKMPDVLEGERWEGIEQLPKELQGAARTWEDRVKAWEELRKEIKARAALARMVAWAETWARAMTRTGERA